jgi:L-fuculose-phosphate aldolase
MLTNIAEREEIIETCAKMSQLGFFIGTWGNISVRVEGGFLITPTRVDYDTMTPEDIVMMSTNGERLGGERLPSSEVELHRAMLLKLPTMNAVIHTHSPMATALSVLGIGIPVITEDMSQIVGGAINCTPYVPGGQHKELAQTAMENIGDANALILGNHGVICSGVNLAEAGTACRIVEKAAGTLMACLSSGHTINTIPEECVKEERYRYLHKYGKQADLESVVK